MTSSSPRGQMKLVLACALAACAAGARPGRDPRLVSAESSVDRDLARAQQLSLADGRDDEAAALLEGILSRAPNDPLSHVAALRLARIEIARAVRASPADAAAHVERAGRLASGVPQGVDPALEMQRDLVLGLLAARAGASAQGLSRLRPLDGRMIDPGENASAACGLLALETAPGGDPVRALRSLARVEAARESAVRWPPTGLGCEDPDARRAALDGVLPRIDREQVLADTLDLLPAGYSGRAVIARRLRALAQARGELNRWLRWLADLGDEEATLSTQAGDGDEDEVSVGLMVPLSGARSAVGVDIVRAVQLALNRQRNVLVHVQDEGRDLDAARRAFDALVQRGARWIIGPTREEFSRAVADWARDGAPRVEVLLLAPWVDATTFDAHRVEAPALRDRVAAMRAEALRVGRRVSVVAPLPGAEEGPISEAVASQTFAGRLMQDLLDHGAAVLGDAAAEVHLLAGSALSARRERVVRSARSAPGRWVVDARLAWLEMPGTWVGVSPGPDFAGVHARFCMLAGHPPGELSLLAHDAARSILLHARGIPACRAAGTSLVAGTEVAARRSCDEVILPPAERRDEGCRDR